MPPSKNPSLAVIRVILQASGKPDDTLTIHPNAHDDNYTVMFVQRTVNHTSWATVRYTRIFDYLENFMRSALIDEEGAQLIQIEAPTYPTVIVRRENIKDYVSLLFDQIENLERNWPLEVNRVENTIPSFAE